MSRQPPDPNSGLYADWKSWAKQVLRYLSEREREQAESAAYLLPQHASASLPSAAQAGLIIYIPDESKAAISTSTGGWKRLKFAT